ncbi:hypothetical protein BDY19DRAFT_1074916 [Irpex rosettiformis]|uniref:Uncharacterized protein n=1 Tax=Irpex rosettiformis TaxID=378272 RepID=A0ACB8TW70_9APHY|nr:hypothetical protein BDY19DRAFT_1074916 [Irpex rosettiformis]
MGSASSKVTRKLPKTKPSWSSARTPASGEPVVQSPKQANLPPEAQRASETRTEAIEEDSRDPHFLAKLNQLGPVKVDHHMRTYQATASHARHAYETRKQSELEARSFRPSKNHILVSSLGDLLNECKAATSPQEIEAIAQRYGIDVSTLENLRNLVNNPTVDPDSIVKTVGPDGEERITMQVKWE